MNIDPWGNQTTTVNGHVVGADDQAAIFWAVNSSLDAYIRRYWLQGQYREAPQGGNPLVRFAPVFPVIETIEQRNEFKGAFVPTQGVQQAAWAMKGRGLVDYPEPSFSDSIFPGGDQLQNELYQALNGYWLGDVP